ncbi:hypothetical protein IE81DRAFT_96934 [Ceraceosorus guamensis]|uniref:Uncharacterized protein n=1 Tax=Ceraceosorus guamensis TaxID=1522189 RepID=A0A316VR69_9BASI|nr:hypothetical protein IE81DRAFT_96934 [Ceraceosorus guamensis]PWN38671.1 hypothetical protein IE81DRAFT_96934 [Ceraceosorus guamensis]
MVEMEMVFMFAFDSIHFHIHVQTHTQPTFTFTLTFTFTFTFTFASPSNIHVIPYKIRRPLRVPHTSKKSIVIDDLHLQLATRNSQLATRTCTPSLHHSRETRSQLARTHARTHEAPSLSSPLLSSLPTARLRSTVGATAYSTRTFHCSAQCRRGTASEIREALTLSSLIVIVVVLIAIGQ